jgi:hypothetical protein
MAGRQGQPDSRATLFCEWVRHEVSAGRKKRLSQLNWLEHNKILDYLLFGFADRALQDRGYQWAAPRYPHELRLPRRRRLPKLRRLG